MRRTQTRPGDRFGPLEVLSRKPDVRAYTPTWEVRCTLCGAESVLTGSALGRAVTAIGCKACIRDRERELAYVAGQRIGTLTLKTRATHAGARSSWYATCDCGAVDVYTVRDLHAAGAGGCQVCKPPEQKPERLPLRHAYTDDIGMMIQRLYLKGLVPG